MKPRQSLVCTKLVLSNITLQSNLFRLKLKGPMILPQNSWVFEFCNKSFAESYCTTNELNFYFEISNETTYFLSSIYWDHHWASVVCRPSVNFSHFNQLLWNHWANLNQTLVEWSLDGPLPKLCLVIPTSNQDGRQAKNRKKGGWNFDFSLLL